MQACNDKEKIRRGKYDFINVLEIKPCGFESRIRVSVLRIVKFVIVNIY